MPRPLHPQPVLPRRPPPVGDGDALAAGQIAAGEGALLGGHLPWPARDQHPASAVARPGAEVDDDVGLAHGLLVVLDDDDGVAHVAQALEGLEQLLVVPRMEADGRLVEDVEDAHQSGADLAGEADALRLAPREGVGAAVQGQVAEADLVEQVEASADLLEGVLGDEGLLLGQLDAVEEQAARLDGEGRDLGQRAAAEEHRQGLGPQAAPVAGGAPAGSHVAAEVPAHLGVAVVEALLDELQGALVAVVMGPGVAAVAGVDEPDPAVPQPLQETLLLVLLQVLPGGIEGEAEVLGRALVQVVPPTVGADVAEGLHGAFAQ